MEELKSNVATIENKIQECRRLLKVYDKSARLKVGNDVSDMRDALVSSEKCITFTVTEMQSFLKQIEYRTVGEIDLKPQIAWLGDKIHDVVALISAAEDKAKAAMSQAMSHESLVADVSQDIAVQQRNLNTAEQRGKQLTTQAEEQLRASESLMREKEADIARKTQEISANLTEVSNLKARLPKLEAELEQKRSDLAAKKRRATSKKENAGGFFAAAGVGVALAPFTFGLSLIPAAGAAVGGIVNTVDDQDIKSEISSTETQISSVSSKISTAQATTTRITREKAELESSIVSLRNAISAQRSAQSRHRTQIQQVSRVQGDVSSIQREASSASATVHDMTSHLLELKHALTQCAATLSGHKTELSVKKSVVDKLVLRKTRHKREFVRERNVILQATEALSGVQGKIPALLPGAQQMRFLELKRASSVQVVKISTGSIPSASVRVK